MIYATIPDIVAVIGEPELILLTDRTSDTPTIVDQAVAGRALEAANGMVDSYVSARITPPLTPVPVTLRDAAVDIAIYKLHVVSTPDDVARKYKDAVAYLRDVQDGTAKLPGVMGSPPTEPQLVEFVSNPKVFGRV